RGHNAETESGGAGRPGCGGARTLSLHGAGPHRRPARAVRVLRRPATGLGDDARPAPRRAGEAGPGPAPGGDALRAGGARAVTFSFTVIGRGPECRVTLGCSRCGGGAAVLVAPLPVAARVFVESWPRGAGGRYPRDTTVLCARCGEADDGAQDQMRELRRGAGNPGGSAPGRAEGAAGAGEPHRRGPGSAAGEAGPAGAARGEAGAEKDEAERGHFLRR